MLNFHEKIIWFLSIFYMLCTFQNCRFFLAHLVQNRILKLKKVVEQYKLNEECTWTKITITNWMNKLSERAYRHSSQMFALFLVSLIMFSFVMASEFFIVELIVLSGKSAKLQIFIVQCGMNWARLNAKMMSIPTQYIKWFKQQLTMAVWRRLLEESTAL